MNTRILVKKNAIALRMGTFGPVIFLPHGA